MPGIVVVALLSYTTPRDTIVVRLSCEHPLGGGMLKLEPGEADQILLPSNAGRRSLDVSIIDEALRAMRSWRHYAE
jgi:hypothetical protein